MRKYSSILAIAATLVCGTAAAKPNSGCPGLFALTRTALDQFNLQPVNLYPGVFVMYTGGDAMWSDVAEGVRARVGEKVSTTLVRSKADLADKRALAEFEKKQFAVVDTLESFILDDRLSLDVEALERLRTVLSVRMNADRPTLLLIEDWSAVHRYLRHLDQLRKVGG